MEQVATNRVVRRGLSLLVGTFSLGAMVGFASFAVDYGRVQLAKAELRRAADAAARVGAGSLPVSTAQALFDARDWSKKNAVDGRKLVDSSITVTVGKWDSATRTYRTALVAGETPNACRVALNRPAVGTEAVPLIWAKLLNVAGCKVEAESIAVYVDEVNVNQQVEGTANPFLAGMPKGSVASLNNPHRSPDYAGDAASSDPAKRRQSPQMVPMTVKEGDILTFDEPVTGTVRHDPNLPFFSPDGELTDIGRNTNGSENGISDIKAPINALVGVFLSDAAPNSTLAPTPDASHDASVSANREFTSMSPQLKETFFIGDGMTSGGYRQSFVVPKGATRLFLATWDFYEWNNNAGNRTIKITRPGRIITVK